MGFLGQFLLMCALGAGAVSVPIVLHFFFRSRYRTVPWAAMRFLLTSMEQTSRRLRFQELLLLLLRMTVLALFTLALMRLVAASAVYAGLAAAVILVPVLLTTVVMGFVIFFGDRWLKMSGLLTFAVMVAVVLFLWLPFAGAGLALWALPSQLPAERSSGTGWNEAVDAVFLFDTSYSMGYKEGDKTRLEQARAAALEIIDKLPPYSTVQIVACADQAWDKGPRVPANLDQAREIIQDLQLTDLSTDLLPGAQKALAALQRRHLPNKELYVFSDMQKSGWERQQAALTETMRQVSQEATIYLIRCGTRKPQNVAVIGITPETGIPQPGERVGFAVMIKNTGTEPMRDLQVALMMDGKDKDKEAQSIKVLAPGDTRAITLSAKMGDVGLHVMTATVKTDNLKADNRFDQVILVREAVKILVIDGALSRDEPKQSSSHYLLHALLSVPEGQEQQFFLQPTLVTPQEAVPELLDSQDLCIFTNVAVKPDLKQQVPSLSREFLVRLNRFVREGHGLMIFAGDNVKPADYNEVLVERYGLLPYKLSHLVQRSADTPIHLNRNSANLQVYQRFKEDKFYELVNEIKVWQALALKSPADEAKEKAKKEAVEDKGDARAESPVTVALRYDIGLPAVVTYKVEAGEVVFFTTAANPGWRADTPDPTWTELPLFPYFPPLIHQTVNHLLPRQTQNYNATAGRPLTWHAPKNEAYHAFVLYQPDGKKRRLGLPTIQGDRPVLTVDGLTVAGIYRLVAVDPNRQDDDIANDPVLVEEIQQGKSKLGWPIAVNPDTSESNDLESLTDDQIDAQLGFRVLHTTAGADTSSLAEVDRTQREWTVWLLIVVLLLSVGESLLAWFCGRPIGRGAKG